MKIKSLCLALLSLLMAAGAAGCSNKEYDPENYMRSVLSGEYGKNCMWGLHVSVNDEPLECPGHVRFESMYLKEGDFRFVEVIPGESRIEFKDVSLTSTDLGYAFSISHTQSHRTVVINGTMAFGHMSVSIIM